MASLASLCSSRRALRSAYLVQGRSTRSYPAPSAYLMYGLYTVPFSKARLYNFLFDLVK